MREDLTRDELIKLLKEEDRAIQEEAKEIERKKIESDLLRLEILRRQKAAEERAMVSSSLEEKRNINELQKYATEASIYKNELQQSDMKMAEIDRQLAELTDNTKNRINKLANQFVELNKERNASLTSLEVKAKNESAEDFKILDRSFRTSYLRNEDIIRREAAKEAVAQQNIEVLTRAIDLSSISKDKKKEVEEFDEIIDNESEE